MRPACARGVNHQACGRCVVREHVDATAVTVVVEAELDGGEPTQRAQVGGSALLRGRVHAIHQPIKPLALPSDRDVDGGAQRLDEGVDPTERDATNEAPLNARYHVSRTAGMVGQVLLAPAGLAAE